MKTFFYFLPLPICVKKKNEVHILIINKGHRLKKHPKKIGTEHFFYTVISEVICVLQTIKLLFLKKKVDVPVSVKIVQTHVLKMFVSW